MRIRYLALAALSVVVACGDDDDGPPPGSVAQQQGVGDACKVNDDCMATSPQCLTNFKGGYCGIKDCQGDVDCPSGSACIAHTDGTNYCFLLCSEKYQCNTYRPADVEANCSSSVDFVDGKQGSKACVPPS